MDDDVAGMFRQALLKGTPRRWGKTTSVGIFVASVLFSVPNAWQGGAS
jgi:hypothetical protein